MKGRSDAPLHFFHSLAKGKMVKWLNGKIFVFSTCMLSGGLVFPSLFKVFGFPCAILSWMVYMTMQRY